LGKKRAVWNIPKANREENAGVEHTQEGILRNSNLLTKAEENAANPLDDPIIVAESTKVQEDLHPSPPKSTAFQF